MKRENDINHKMEPITVFSPPLPIYQGARFFPDTVFPVYSTIVANVNDLPPVSVFCMQCSANNTQPGRNTVLYVAYSRNT